MGAVHWGDVPTWLAAVGTVGTLIVTTVLLRREQQDRRSAQAATIAANLANMTTFGGQYWDVDVTNASASPIYECLVEYVDEAGLVRGSGTLAVVGPGATEHGEYEITPPSPPAAAERIRARLTFVDSAGRRWQRDEHGRLRELRHTRSLA